MLKINNIDINKLTQAGYEATEDGYRKKFPSRRFCFYLYLQTNGIYGTITGKMGSDEVLDLSLIHIYTSRNPIRREIASIPPLPTSRIIAPELRRLPHKITCLLYTS